MAKVLNRFRALERFAAVRWLPPMADFAEKRLLNSTAALRSPKKAAEST